MGGEFKGVYNLYTDTIHLYTPGQGSVLPGDERIDGLDSDAARELLADEYEDFCEEIELVRGASHEFELECLPRGQTEPGLFRHGAG